MTTSEIEYRLGAGEEMPRRRRPDVRELLGAASANLQQQHRDADGMAAMARKAEHND